MDTSSPMLLSSRENKILWGLRELPDGALRSMVEEFLLELTTFLRDPHCAQVQADGIPCDDPSADCEQCLKVRELIETLRHTIAND